MFIDLEKAYDGVPRKVIWKYLEKKVFVAHIRVTNDMDGGVKICGRTLRGDTNDFSVVLNYIRDQLYTILFSLFTCMNS